MRYPVTASDGYTYEEQAIKTWLNGKKVSPMTRQAMQKNQLNPSLFAQQAIEEKIHEIDKVLAQRTAKSKLQSSIRTHLVFFKEQNNVSEMMELEKKIAIDRTI